MEGMHRYDLFDELQGQKTGFTEIISWKVSKLNRVRFTTKYQ